MPKPDVNLAACNGCAECVDFCPPGALAIVNGKVTVVKPEACSYCLECESICSSGAISCPLEIILVKKDSKGSK